MTCLAIRVRQPIGEFFLTTLPAQVLLNVCFSKPHSRYSQNADGSVFDRWIQRKRAGSRINSIRDYLCTTEATLPGTLVLAANFTENGEFVGDDDNGVLDSRRWTAKVVDEGRQLFELTFPDDQKLVAVVDGQHRLGGFEKQSDMVLKMDLPCAIFLDMPIPIQAYVFATINFNQKPVSKSQTFELFGYNIDHEEPMSWSPDKLAVFLTRKLNADDSSPIHGHVKISAIDYTEINLDSARDEQWSVSTATFVTGILSLITTSPQNDRNLLGKLPLSQRTRSILRRMCLQDNNQPLWDYYLEGCDELIYKIVCNFFLAAEDLFNKGQFHYAIFHKTIGINSLFKVLRILLPVVIKEGDVRPSYWSQIFKGSGKMVDFNDGFLKGSSGTHVGRVRDMLLLMAGYNKLEDFSNNKSFKEYERLWNNARYMTNA